MAASSSSRKRGDSMRLSEEIMSMARQKEKEKKEAGVSGRGQGG